MKSPKIPKHIKPQEFLCIVDDALLKLEGAPKRHLLTNRIAEVEQIFGCLSVKINYLPSVNVRELRHDYGIGSRDTMSRFVIENYPHPCRYIRIDGDEPSWTGMLYDMASTMPFNLIIKADLRVESNLVKKLDIKSAYEEGTALIIRHNLKKESLSDEFYDNIWNQLNSKYVKS
ncbi:MAG: hypothetical protein ABIF10_02750 [Candidatus Woesearchaeota archaeon]